LFSSGIPKNLYTSTVSFGQAIPDL